LEAVHRRSDEARWNKQQPERAKGTGKDLHYSGDMNDSATMNVWLHKEVLRKLAENGGKVPQDLLK
jgi:hypothetical protein